MEMKRTLNTRFIRYLNLFGKVTGVRTNHCFICKNNLVFVVRGNQVSKAVGVDGKNVKKLSKIMNKNIKIVPTPEDVGIKRFIAVIIEPAKFKDVEVVDNKVVIEADRQDRAMMIGRNKVNLIELKNIIKEYFGKNLEIR